MIDILSYATNQEEPGIVNDLTQDCDGSYIDSIIYLFRNSTGDDGNLTQVIGSNDDDIDFNKRDQQQSINRKDSYLERALKKGSYILAIGRYPLSAEDAALGFNSDQPALLTPSLCGQSSDYGNYEVMFSSTATLVATSPETYIGNRCAENAEGLICPKYGS